VNRLRRYLPFLAWFPMTRETLRADFFAGASVGLILIPQSMAYAQLAGLPPYYGLYAAFLPVLVGVLWGSSYQLATGPVAMVSLLTGATLSQLAAPGSDQFIALAIGLALMVGVMELAMGIFRLGAIVSFISHPVIIGFTNAAAIIIALSQLNKLLGISSSRSESFMTGVWSVLHQVGDTHVPTLLMGLAALAMMIAVRRFAPRWPGVLIAVMVTTLVSWQIGYERKGEAPVSAIVDTEVRFLASEFAATAAHIGHLSEQAAEKSLRLGSKEKTDRHDSQLMLALKYEIEVLRLEIRDAERENRVRARALRKFVFERAESPGGGEARFHLADSVPDGDGTDGRRWRVGRIVGDQLELIGGGEVVGDVPSGLPTLQFPAINWDLIITLMSTAFVITLIGFMEALSIAKAMATRTRQRLAPNQELIGQGLANLAGSVSQAFPVSGSFSRSALNLAAGAVTGMSSVFSWLMVLAALLFLTPLLYHLPQAVLAAIIMMAVVNLVNFRALRHAWEAHRHDGIAAIVTFLATLGFAPHLDTGILLGAGLAVVLYLYRTMRPRVAVLGRHPDGTLRDADRHNLDTSEHIIVIRFDGALFFANVPYFEDAVLEQVAKRPKAKFILIAGDAINEIDGSGEEAIRRVAARLKENGVTMVFSGLKYQALRVLENTGLIEEIGAQNIFRTENYALADICQRIDDPEFDPDTCVLNVQPAAPAAPSEPVQNGQQNR
jgi:sulfate permease, SulP family